MAPAEKWFERFERLGNSWCLRDVRSRSVYAFENTFQRIRMISTLLNLYYSCTYYSTHCTRSQYKGLKNVVGKLLKYQVTKIGVLVFSYRWITLLLRIVERSQTFVLVCVYSKSPRKSLPSGNGSPVYDVLVGLMYSTWNSQGPGATIGGFGPGRTATSTRVGRPRSWEFRRKETLRCRSSKLNVRSRDSQCVSVNTYRNLAIVT